MLSLFKKVEGVKISKILAIIGNILAIIIFGVGLLAPLTPSTGMPSIGSILIFVGLPLLLLLLTWRIYLSKVSMYAVITQGLCIAGFVSYLLMLQAGLLS